jgi:hypothetical protein
MRSLDSFGRTGRCEVVQSLDVWPFAPDESLVGIVSIVVVVDGSRAAGLFDVAGVLVLGAPRVC